MNKIQMQKNIGILEQKKHLFIIPGVLGMILFFSCFAYCQNSVKQQTNYYGKALVNDKTSNSFLEKSDSLRSLKIAKREKLPNEQDSSGIQNKYMDETLLIGGLVIDHTQSKWGRDFVDLFNKSFDPPEKFNDYTIVIEEKPLPQFGTLILMKVNGNYVYQRFIQPRYQTIKLNAEQASGIALQYLANYQQIQKDLQGEDLKGTGIY